MTAVGIKGEQISIDMLKRLKDQLLMSVVDDLKHIDGPTSIFELHSHCGSISVGT